jgi:hypothetical protein
MRMIQRLASTVLLLVAVPAGAQPSASTTPTLKSLGLSCDDFAPIGKGVWKPTHPVDLTNGPAKVTITLQTAIRPDSIFANLPLAAMLKAECVK